MTPERYQEVSRLCSAALALEPAQRAAYLVSACKGDEALRREVESLLGYEAQGTSLLEQPALAAVAPALAAEQPDTLIKLPLERVGHCRLLSQLGRGGMGEVWLAEDTQLGRKVAVKLLPAEFTADAERVRRFAQEARATSALNHPNIITFHEIGQHENTHYLVTEYIAGETLRQRLQRAPQLPLPEALEAATQIAAALSAAHEAGITHRDIKPENVMLRRDGLVKVLDFGLAKLTAAPAADSQAATLEKLSTGAGLVMGAPRYMSPEQARGEKVDARSDIFSFGVLLYEMIAGRPPFVGATVSEVIAAILRDAPAPLEESAAPPELAQIIQRALQKEREARYPTMRAALDELKQLQRRLERESEAPTFSPDEAATLTLAQATQANEQAIVTGQRQALWRARKLAVACASVLLLAAVAVAGFFRFFQSPATDSLAVLPFVNVGANPDAEYLADGITDGLINSLSRLPKLKVMSRSAVLRYKGKEADAQAAGQALGVRAVLTGKVTQRGDELLISTELVDVRDNSHLGGDQRSYKLSNLLAVQDLARDVSQQLRLPLSRAEQQQLAKRGTENAEAYELYLKGRHLMESQADSQQASFRYFQQAVEKDPRFASAWAGLAESYMYKAGLGATHRLAPKDAYPLAKAAAEKAVALDDTLAEVHVSLARIAFQYEWDWLRAEREFQRAIALKADYAPARHWYSHLLVALGRFDESLAESQRLLALNPLDAETPYHLGFHYWNARQYDQAVAQLQKALALKPNFSGPHSMLSSVYVKQGRYQEAIEERQKGGTMGAADNRGNLGYIYALAGRRAEARELLKQLLEEAKTKTKIVSPYNIALILAGLDEKDQAFAWLDKALAERDGNLTLPGLKVDTRIDGLRPDPRFAALLRRMNLTP
jgi:TolB-like protein/Flp pilus assembly protein TadD